MPEEPQYLEIGQRLRSIREAFGDDDTATSWAEKNQFNRSQYSNWENGSRRIPVEQSVKLCDLFGLTLDFIYRGRRDGLSLLAAGKLK